MNYVREKGLFKNITITSGGGLLKYFLLAGVFFAPMVNASQMAHIDEYGNIFFIDVKSSNSDIKDELAKASQNLRAGIAAFNLKRYKDAIPKLEHAANYRNSKALYILGIIYANGWDIPPDYDKASRYLTESASLQNEHAMYALGDMNLKRGVKTENPAEKEKKFRASVNWFLQAAQKGHTFSQTVIAEFYYGAWTQIAPDVDFLKKTDYEQAAYWYLKAAKQGDLNAQVGIADMYERGLGVTKDLNKAREWFEKAAARGHRGAINHLKNIPSAGKND